ncbi:MAG: glycosyltransferase family 1 protein, partial [Anaerolineae bacterium]|nr:glycosyltransferase family 1 protein [Anaerolineae bacterium]
MILGIDASNIGSGGTKNHLFHLLRHFEAGRYGIQKIVVWGGQRVFSMLYPRKDIEYVHIPMLDKALPFRSWWQAVHLTPLARRSCDVLFAPGSTYIGNFHPFVSLYQNMQPFMWKEMRRYPLF